MKKVISYSIGKPAISGDAIAVSVSGSYADGLTFESAFTFSAVTGRLAADGGLRPILERAPMGYAWALGKAAEAAQWATLPPGTGDSWACGLSVRLIARDVVTANA